MTSRWFFNEYFIFFFSRSIRLFRLVKMENTACQLYVEIRRKPRRYLNRLKRPRRENEIAINIDSAAGSQVNSFLLARPRNSPAEFSYSRRPLLIHLTGDLTIKNIFKTGRRLVFLALCRMKQEINITIIILYYSNIYIILL